MFRSLFLACLAATSASFFTTTTPARAACDMATPCPAPSPDQSPTSSAGQVVFLDPDTGEVLTGEAAARAATDASRVDFADAMALQMRRDFSVENLTESRTETGAVAVNLQGRFQSAIVAVIDPERGLRIGHVNKEGRLD